MKAHLFYTFLGIYVATAALALLGITGVLAIKDGYLTPLMGAFLLESAGAVVALFRSAKFFQEDFQPPPQLPPEDNQPGNPRPDMPIRIISAHYGTSQKNVDVTSVLRAKMQNGALELQATTSELCNGDDPIYGVTKSLTLEYEFNGRIRTIVVPEDRWLILP